MPNRNWDFLAGHKGLKKCATDRHKRGNQMWKHDIYCKLLLCIRLKVIGQYLTVHVWRKRNTKPTLDPLLVQIGGPTWPEDLLFYSMRSLLL